MNTLCQETNIYLNQKVGFEGIPKLLSYWKLQPVAHKVNTEWKSESSLLTKTNSHSWVRIFHGLNKLVTNLNNKDQDGNEQETSEVQLEEYALKLNASDFASRSKAEAKPQRRDSASSSTRTVLIGERTWTNVEPRTHSNIAYPVSKRLINLLRHGSLPRENDGAIELWRIKDNLQKHYLYCHHWSDEK